MKTLEFWFEFGSTYSYLAATRVESMAEKAGVIVAWRPFLLGPIFQTQLGYTDSPFKRQPARGAYMWRDVERFSEEYGLSFRRPSSFPRNAMLAARVALLAEETPWCPEFVKAVFRANFEQDLEVGDPDVVGRILAELGQPAAILEDAQSTENKERLKARGREAVARGIFGAPNFFADGEHFFGNDRLENALAWLSRPSR